MPRVPLDSREVLGEENYLIFGVCHGWVVYTALVEELGTIRCVRF